MFLKDLCRSFQELYFGLDPSCVLIPTMAGTLSMDLANALGSSGMILERLSLPQLKKEEQIQVIKSVWKEANHPWTESFAFQNLLTLFGSHPRSLEYLISGFDSKLQNGKKFQEVNAEKVSDWILNQFNLDKRLVTSEEAMLDLLFLYCLRHEERVPKERNVPGLQNTRYEHLAGAGSHFDSLFLPPSSFNF